MKLRTEIRVEFTVMRHATETPGETCSRVDRLLEHGTIRDAFADAGIEVVGFDFAEEVKG